MPKSWVEDPASILKSFNISPVNSLGDRINTYTRLSLVVTVVLMLSGFKHSLLFLLLSLVLIILLYYLQKRSMQANCQLTENYQGGVYSTQSAPKYQSQPPYMKKPSDSAQVPYAYGTRLVTGTLPATYSQVDTKTKIGMVQNSTYNIPDRFNAKRFVAPGQMLAQVAGNGFRNAYRSPVIPAPSMSKFWRDPTVSVSGVNNETSQYQYDSGYMVTSRNPSGSREDFVYNAYNSEDVQIPTRDLHTVKSVVPSENSLWGRKPNIGGGGGLPPSTLPSSHPENDDSADSSENPGGEIIRPPQIPPESFGKVLNSGYYDPSNISRGGISNFRPPRGLENDRARNVNISTNTNQPGNYFKSDIIEPVNANLGISFAPGSRVLSTIDLPDNDGNYTTKTRHMTVNLDPGVSGFVGKPTAVATQIGPADVYDARNSYADNDRRYVDTVLGQPKWVYTDVNAARMPTHVGRNSLPIGVGPAPYGTPSVANAAGVSAVSIRNDAQVHSVAQMNAQSSYMGDALAAKYAGRTVQLRDMPIYR